MRNPIYSWDETHYTVGRRWDLPQQRAAVFLAESIVPIATGESEPAGVKSEDADSVSHAAFPAEQLPHGWSLEAIASVLERLPCVAWRHVCLWTKPPFPPKSIGDAFPDLPEAEREWLGEDWSAQRLQQDWFDCFPWQMNARSPEDEIVRQWSIYEGNRRARSEHSAYDAAFRLDGGSGSYFVLWEAVTRTLFIEASAEPRGFQQWPICTLLMLQMLRWSFEEIFASFAGARQALEKAAKLEEQLVSQAMSSLRDKLGADAVGADAQTAARLLVSIGTPADVELLRCLGHFDLKAWPVSRHGLECLERMAWLQSLDLSNARIQGGTRSLKVLSSLTGLKKLALANLSLQNSDVGFLRKLTALEELDLSGNRLGDGGTSVIALYLSPRKLDLRFNEISDGAKKELRRRLPNCELLL
jgi:hypothetical protein